MASNPNTALEFILAKFIHELIENVGGDLQEFHLQFLREMAHRPERGCGNQRTGDANPDRPDRGVGLWQEP